MSDDRFITPRFAAAGVLLVFGLLALYAAIVVASALAGRAPGEALVAQMTPLPFYLFALWSAGRTIRRIGGGVGLRALVSPMLRRIGWSLFFGGLSQVFLTPWLLGPSGGGSFAFFDANAMTLGAIGLTLVIVARLVGDAERDRAELDSFV